jgi:hypothetical protein
MIFYKTKQKMKTKLEIGDKIRRFELQRTREIDTTYEIIAVTKTLAKSETKTFKIGLRYNIAHPKVSKYKTIALVDLKDKSTSSDSYFLIKNK